MTAASGPLSSSVPFFIRAARTEDTPNLEACYRAFLNSQHAISGFGVQNPSFDLSRYVADKLASPQGAVFVAEVNGRVVGVADCSVRFPGGMTPRPTGRGLRRLIGWGLRRLRAINTSPRNFVEPEVVGYLNNYFVEAALRSQGIGTALLTHCVKHLREACNVKTIFAHVLASNLASMRALERCGFVQHNITMRNGVDHLKPCERTPSVKQQELVPVSKAHSPNE